MNEGSWEQAAIGRTRSGNEGSWEQAAVGRTRSGNARGETEEWNTKHKNTNYL